MNYTMSVEQIKEAIRDRLAHTFAVSLENATDEEYYKASALIVRELLAKGRSEFVQNAEKTGTKQIYYLCLNGNIQCGNRLIAEQEFRIDG